MTIETKHNTKSEVWYMYDNRAIRGKIVKIQIGVDYDGNTTIFCTAESDTNSGSHYAAEQKYFKSKTDLLNSL